MLYRNPLRQQGTGRGVVSLRRSTDGSAMLAAAFHRSPGDLVEASVLIASR